MIDGIKVADPLTLGRGDDHMLSGQSHWNHKAQKGRRESEKRRGQMPGEEGLSPKFPALRMEGDPQRPWEPGQPLGAWLIRQDCSERNTALSTPGV